MNTGKQHLVYLTGFMGSGKSTVGPILANSLGWDYYDLDRLLEEKTGRTINEIFAEHGEAWFRAMEHSLLLELCSRTECVISLGGGTITHKENLSIVKSSGILVYLKLSTGEAYRRLRNKTDRPLLRKPDGDRPSEQELRDRVVTLLSNREPDYSQADITIVTEKRVGSTVDELLRKLRPFIVNRQ